jgi:mycothiol synthase
VPEPDATKPTARVSVTAELAADDVARVTELVDAATGADGVGPLSEHVVLHLRHGGDTGDRHLVLRVPDGATDGAGTVAGYAHLDPTDAVEGASAELVVHPAHRGHGHGRQLVAATIAAADELSAGRPDGARLRLWAHGDLPAAKALAASMGFEEVRRLLQLRRPLDAPLPAVDLPPGVVLRTFRPGADDDEWLAVNALAFRDHPEQGKWTRADLEARMAEDWFDPEGFLVAERGGRMAGFHWTKVHGGDPAAHGHEPIGEVYVVGVDPHAQGGGLGRALTLAGLHRLRAQGLGHAMLYVEADNAPALAVYRRLGFGSWHVDVMYRSAPGGGTAPTG